MTASNASPDGGDGDGRRRERGPRAAAHHRHRHVSSPPFVVKALGATGRGLPEPPRAPSWIENNRRIGEVVPAQALSWRLRRRGKRDDRPTATLAPIESILGKRRCRLGEPASNPAGSVTPAGASRALARRLHGAGQQPARAAKHRLAPALDSSVTVRRKERAACTGMPESA